MGLLSWIDFPLIVTEGQAFCDEVTRGLIVGGGGIAAIMVWCTSSAESKNLYSLRKEAVESVFGVIKGARAASNLSTYLASISVSRFTDWPTCAWWRWV